MQPGRFFNKALLTGIALSMMVFAAMVTFSYRQTEYANNTAKLMAHTQQELYSTEKVVASIIDNETGSRGFILTGQESFLEPLEQSKKNILTDIYALQKLIADNPNHKKNIDSLLFYANKRMAFSYSTIKIRKEKGLNAAVAIVSGGQGKLYGDRVRQIIGGLQNEANEVFKKNNIENEQAVAKEKIILLIITLVILALLVTVFWNESKRTEKKLINKTAKKLAFLSFQINQSNDAIYTLDASRKIQTWNKGAEILYGFTSEEAAGCDPLTLLKTEITNEEVAMALIEISENNYWTGELIRTTKDGRRIFVHSSTTGIHNSSGKITGYIAVSHDITGQKILHEQVNHLANIVEQSSEAIFSRGIDHHIISWNKGAEKLFGYSKTEAIGKKMAELGFTLLGPDEIQAIEKQVIEKGSWKSEIYYRHKDGSTFFGAVTANLIKNEKGENTSFYFIVKDISVRKELEDRLIDMKEELELRVKERTDDIAKSEKRFRSLIENNYDIISLMDASFKIIYRSPSAYRVSGWRDEEMINLSGTKNIHPDELDYSKRIIEELMAKPGETINTLFRNQHKNGHYLWMEGTVVNMLHDESIRAIVFNYRDVTQRIEAENQLAASEKRFRTLIDNNNDIITLLDNSFKITYRSPSSYRIMGWTNEEMDSEDGTKNVHPDDIDYAKSIVKDLMEQPGKPINTLCRLQHKEGHYLWMEGTVVNMLHDENIKAIVFNYRDVTQRIEAEKKLAASEMRFRLLIENSADGIDLSDEFSNNIYRSPGAIKITGILPKENQRDFTHPDDVETIKNIQEEFIKKPGIPVAFQARFRHSLGHYIWLEGAITNLLNVEGMNAIVTNFRDITQRKELEMLLHKANTLARIGGWEVDLIKGTVYWTDITREIHETTYSYTPNLEDGLHFYKEGKGRDLITQKVKEAIEEGKPWDVELQIITAKNNEKWIRTIGETEFVNGKCIRIYGSFQDIDERKKAVIDKERLNERLQLATQSAQLGLWDWDVKNNRLIWDDAMYRLYNLTENEFTTVYDGWASRVHEEDRQRVDNEIQLALENKKDYNPEFRIVWTDSSVHHIIATGIIERDHDGNALRMTGFNWDVTERKTAEEKIKNINIELEEKVIKRTEELLSANKEMESFSYSVSHDLRAPLRAIIGYSNILEEDYGSKLDDEAKRITGVIKDNTQKMAALIDDLLAFSKMGRHELLKTSIDTQEMVGDIKSTFDKINIRNQAIKWIIHPLPFVKADASTIRQVWMNLLSNAIKYSGKAEASVIEVGSFKQNNQLVFYVKDNGVGFNEKYKDKLFKVFQRLHSIDEFEGTGIGLAIVEKIISKHGGKVWAEGAVGKGSCFYFSLPDK